MIRVLLVTGISVALGCAPDVTASPRKKDQSKREGRVTSSPLEWSLANASDGKSLVVEISVANTTDGPLWVAEKAVVPAAGGKFTRSDRLTVMNTDDPKTIRFVLGAVSSDAPSTMVYEPTFAKISPGESAHRKFVLPLPLQSWNPVGRTNPLSREATQAKLYVHTSRAEPSTWTELRTDDREPLRTPEWDKAMTILEGKTLPLPR